MGRTNKSSCLEPTEHIRPGFTLVELLVVIAILIAFLIPSSQVTTTP